MYPNQPFQPGGFGGQQQPYGQPGYQQQYAGQQGFGHQVNCPRCHSLMTEVKEPESGVNIDVCNNPNCGGYYFDFL